jgi:hypothetical protein
VGPYAGNYDEGTNAPAHTAVIDYFFDSAAPIEPEDGAPGPALSVTVLGQGVVAVNPDQTGYTCDEVVTLTATADAGFQLKSWSGTDDDSLTAATNTVTMDADKTVTVEFEPATTVQYQLSASVVGGNGTIIPTGGSYYEGEVVTLTATADTGYRVKSWSGTDDDSLTTATNTVTMDADKTVTVEFELVPVVQYDLTVNISGSGSVVLNPPGGVYDEGTTVELTAIADGDWDFSDWTGDLNGVTNPAVVVMDSNKGVTANFVLVEPLTIISDDFNHNNLNTALWAIINPLSDAIVKLEGAGFGDAKLLLTVPAGLSHDPWNENEAARLMQAAADTDFEIEVKFDSLVQQRYQDQGIIVEQSANNWLRFDVFSDGSQTYIFAASVANGTPSVKIYKAIAAAAPIYLNVERTGNTWSLSYSYDGLAWRAALRML